MNIKLSAAIRAIVKGTLPLVERHQEAIEDAMTRYMSRYGPYDPTGKSARTAVWAIMNMLVAHAYEIAGRERLPCLEDMGRNHRAIGLGSAHYSIFGDGLRPILKDVMGSEATSSVVSAWIDAYWAIVRAARRQDLPMAA